MTLEEKLEGMREKHRLIVFRSLAQCWFRRTSKYRTWGSYLEYIDAFERDIIRCARRGHGS